MTSRTSKPNITQDRLHEVLDYDPLKGEFYWKERLTTKFFVGDRAGTLHKQGYRQINLFGKNYKEHRLAWFYVHGYWPEVIDHINHVRDDNRISNLREVTRSENARNLSKIANNTGIPGIWYNRKTGRYVSSIKLNGKKVFQKTYSESELELAERERKEKLKELGFHENHGS